MPMVQNISGWEGGEICTAQEMTKGESSYNDLMELREAVTTSYMLNGGLPESYS